jgi:hypothetical protein
MGLFQSKSPSSSLPILGPTPQPSPPRSSGVLRFVFIAIAAAILFYIGYTFYNYLRAKKKLPPITLTGDTSSEDQAPEPLSGKKQTTISSAKSSVGTGVDYGVQFWMYISDWDFNFAKEKLIMSRRSTTQETPKITLHPTDNSLNVQVLVYPSEETGGAPTEGASVSDAFTCTVENVPIQTWFSVSVTVFQRNLDIYINGRLVKSCVLPGVPKPISGDLIIGDDNNGFSGSVCNIRTYLGMLSPDDALTFFSRGTQCLAPTPTKTEVSDDSIFITLFGYTFRLSKLDKKGNEISSYTF